MVQVGTLREHLLLAPRSHLTVTRTFLEARRTWFALSCCMSSKKGLAFFSHFSLWLVFCSSYLSDYHSYAEELSSYLKHAIQFDRY